MLKSDYVKISDHIYIHDYKLQNLNEILSQKVYHLYLTFL